MKGNVNLLDASAVQSLGFTKGEVLGMVVGPAVGGMLLTGGIGLANLLVTINNNKKTRQQQAEALEWQKQQAILTHENIANYAQISTNQALESMYAMLQEMRSENDDPVVEVYENEGENT